MSKKSFKRRVYTLRRKIQSKYRLKRRKSASKKRRTQRGGYSQYQNNLPLTRSYSLGGDLGNNPSALANPPLLSLNGVDCRDNYDHYNGTSFPSRGH